MSPSSSVYTIDSLYHPTSSEVTPLSEHFRFHHNYQESSDAYILNYRQLNQATHMDESLYIGLMDTPPTDADLRHYTKQGIVIAKAPSTSTTAVKELVLCGMLMASRHIDRISGWEHQNFRKGNIQQTIDQMRNQLIGREIANKTLGVIGLGATGLQVANMAVTLGMNVLAHDTDLTVTSALEVSNQVKLENDLPSLLGRCDYVTLHIPFSDKNVHLMNQETISYCKEGQILLNFSHTGLVDLNALELALDHGKISKYVVDHPNKKTLSLPNTINFPQISDLTVESNINTNHILLDQMQNYLLHGNIIHSINFPHIDFGPLRNGCRIAILHHNIPNMIGQITGILAQHDVNINRLSNKHANHFAYTMIELEEAIAIDQVQDIESIEGVLKMRMLYPMEAKSTSE